jgi:membrane fusion protein (multidrug efflux system)
MFATAQIVQGEVPNAFLIPQAALTRTPTGQAMAMLVGADNKVAPRPVTTVGTQGSNWIVTEGLNPGDKVIVDGIAKVKPEQQVVPKPYQPQAAAPQGAAPSEKKADDAKEQPEQKPAANA